MYERVFGQGFVSPGGMSTTKVSMCEDLSIVFNDLFSFAFYSTWLLVNGNEKTDFVVSFGVFRNLLVD